MKDLAHWEIINCGQMIQELACQQVRQGRAVDRHVETLSCNTGLYLASSGPE